MTAKTPQTRFMCTQEIMEKQIKTLDTHSADSFAQQYHFLSARFLEAMNEIGQYGHEKYGVESFHHRREIGDNSRGNLGERTQSASIAGHSKEHFNAYLRGELHDHFATKRHQLAAVAFNAMMEFYFAGLEEEP